MSSTLLSLGGQASTKAFAGTIMVIHAILCGLISAAMLAQKAGGKSLPEVLPNTQKY